MQPFSARMLAPALTQCDESAFLQRTTYCLLAPCLQRTNGTGPTVDLGLDRAGLLVVSMGINHVIENERLSVSIWGSTNGDSWGDQPLVTCPPKRYCGVYATFLNLSAHPEIRYLRASWSMERGCREPLFGFYISAQRSTARFS
jgi:hypothetical protein